MSIPSIILPIMGAIMTAHFDLFLQYQAASHYFGHLYLVELLKDKLVSSAPARIVWTTSASEALGTINWDNIE